MTPNRKKLPQKPGCYLYFHKNKVIYVGKAKDLKKRINSYFTKKDLDPKTKILVSKIEKIDYIITDSEVEAMILENNLIKKYKPKYNINLKDSKSYSYIEITKEKFPRLISSRSQKIKNKKNVGELYGPFTSGEDRDAIIEILNKTFKLRTCKKIPKRKCIRYDMNLCSGPCINKISREDYMENIKQAKLVLNGKTKELKEILQKKMNNFSKEKNFEKAILIREKISSLNLLEEKQKMQRRKNYNEDIINYVLQDEKIYLMIFNIYKGTLENKKTFQFESKPNFLEEFLIQYYFENPIPKRIILPKKVENIGVYLSKLKNSKVEIFVPKKGELKKLLELVKMNIIEKYFEKEEILKELQKKLNLKKIPKIIECFDISHLGGTQVVGSMVQFRNAKPNKQNYRKFKIKAEDKNDDFSNMNEIIKRRYSKLKKENKTFPDLIVVDGGLGQLNSSLKALKEIEVKIPIISLAKKFEEIYLPNKEIIQLGEKNKARKLLEFIRNEAHRFAIKYQRERRRKSYFT